jgi:putative ABC transport system permease protein
MRQSMQTLAHDVRYAVRSFRRHPAFFAVALLSLTLGIGATTAIFSVIYGVLIAPYPYARPGEIWSPTARSLDGRSTRGAYTIDEFLELTKLPAFSEVMATGFDTVVLTGEFAPESFGAILLSGNAFRFLGVPPVAGRTIQPSDIRSTGDAEPVVVLSYRVWMRLFNGDPAAIGRTLRLNDRPHTIVGVMPPRFGWYGNDTIWLPLGTTIREGRRVIPIVRLAPGVTAKTAEDQLHALHVRLAKETPAAYPSKGFTTHLTNYMDITVASGEMRNALLLLLGAVGFLLLIACANVANLQLARASARAREMAVRLSIGAARWRVLRQLLTESVLLSLIGGAAGVLFAIAATKAITALMPEFYVPNEARVSINTTVLLFSLAVSVLTGIVFGLTPALQASRPDVTDALKEGGRAGGGPRGNRTRNVLVVVEVALSVVLLASAGLMIRTFFALQQIDPGIKTDRVLLTGVPLPPARYKTLEERNNFARQLLERVEGLPGVQTAALGIGGMPYMGPQSPFAIEGRPETEARRVTLNMISAGYLRTLGIPLRRGRALEEAEITRGDHVALINEAAVRLWPAGVDPIGSRVQLAVLETPPRNVAVAPGGGSFTIVGIVANIRNTGLRSEPAPVVLIPYTLVAPPQRMLALRTTLDPMSLLNPVRAQVRELDKEQPLGRPITLDEVLDSELVQPRFTMALFGFFAAFGLALAAAGLYSVLSFNVTRRTHEIGVRMALGARPADILRLMLAMGGRLVLVGIAVGVPISLVTSRLLQNQLFGVKPIDVPAYAAVGLMLGAVALAACFVPARRAAAVDPMIALRHE